MGCSSIPKIIGTLLLLACCFASPSIFAPAPHARKAHGVIQSNHPSGESTPSEADIKVIRDRLRAGQLLKIELLDHVVIGYGNFSSLRTLGRRRAQCQATESFVRLKRATPQSDRCAVSSSRSAT